MDTHSIVYYTITTLVSLLGYTKLWVVNQLTVRRLQTDTFILFFFSSSDQYSSANFLLGCDWVKGFSFRRMTSWWTAYAGTDVQESGPADRWSVLRPTVCAQRQDPRKDKTGSGTGSPTLDSTRLPTYSQQYYTIYAVQTQCFVSFISFVLHDPIESRIVHYVVLYTHMKSIQEVNILYVWLVRNAHDFANGDILLFYDHWIHLTDSRKNLVLVLMVRSKW